MKKSAIIFDLDGTLLDTLADLTEAVNYALGAYGYGTLDRERVRRYVGNGVPMLIERALHYATTGEDLTGDNFFHDRGAVNACLATFTQFYDVHNMDLTKPYDGVSEMLKIAKALGLKTAIVTNKYDGAAQSLKDVFFPTVDAVVGARTGVNPKPSPDGVNIALGMLGVDRSQAVYVGDGETDMKTARGCGMPAIAVTWGFRDMDVLREFSPEIIINKPEELFDAMRAHGYLD